jgi:hypothetical protein
MRNRFGFFALVAIWVALLGFRMAAQEPALAFVHVNVIDATGSPVQADMTVVVQGKEILQIGKSKDVAVPKSTKVVESRGKYLIPGLWDMHAHEIFGAWLPEDEKVIPLLFVANGVTGAGYGRRSRTVKALALAHRRRRNDRSAYDHCRSYAGWAGPGVPEFGADQRRGRWPQHS